MNKDWFDIGSADDFADGEVAPAHAGGQALAVFRLGDDVFALKDLCTHGNAKLSDGYVENGCIECPLHQGLFDIRSGAPRCAPVTDAVRSFPVRVVAGRVEVDVAAPAAEVAEKPQAAVRQLSAVVETITRAAGDVAVLHLRIDVDADADASAGFAYRAGQYVDVLLADGQRRSYSMAAPGGSLLELHVRHLPGGVFTDRVFGSLQAGESLSLEGPGGNFYLRETAKPVILLASGTGFAPIKALVEEAIAAKNQRPMRLYWGGRKQADLYMDALCRQWAATLPWFEYVPVLSEPEVGAQWSGRTGYVHLAVMQDCTDMTQYEAYACGAPIVVETARREFIAGCGLPEHCFFADAFLSKADARK
ncbi:anthranilate 1,2-dioxygenase ferredoxin subunit AndAb [Herbaspirillum sp. RTI4]|uniref:anthranilate 1,2-dioxygenase ferredoxin subunit AndAb n=1 Tax=Herbaspirillum sp. RTI4 TaxID=3048640 RepID=UPI002AB38770|nr:anthranilate 1,2-dioxygenase ferredoxin subunit AndAb [Herbaspirillum sp. RTI4]MDY7577190.1 anthranilate 1,2-dioxygenase ferredoxin subunit AndAb [Herbaspirillum sp. RTI4]MEA9980480.1 anthranilate 1,2-dioxygenase ferredoxin subunit AndAb [Herbaspirillum sp. RTI4]